MRVDKEAVMKHTTSGSSSPTFLFKMFMVIVFIMIHYDTKSECQPCSLCIASIKMGKIKAMFIGTTEFISTSLHKKLFIHLTAQKAWHKLKQLAIIRLWFLPKQLTKIQNHEFQSPIFPQLF